MLELSLWRQGGHGPAGGQVPCRLVPPAGDHLTAPESLARWAPAQDTRTCHPVSAQGTPALGISPPGRV